MADTAAEIACASCGAQVPHDARFCPSCGTALAAAPAFEERRTVTALFADVVGSTATAESLDVEHASTAESSSPSSLDWVPFSSAWVSKPPSLTS